MAIFGCTCRAQVEHLKVLAMLTISLRARTISRIEPGHHYSDGRGAGVVAGPWQGRPSCTCSLPLHQSVCLHALDILLWRRNFRSLLDLHVDNSCELPLDVGRVHVLDLRILQHFAGVDVGNPSPPHLFPGCPRPLCLELPCGDLELVVYVFISARS